MTHAETLTEQVERSQRQASESQQRVYDREFSPERNARIREWLDSHDAHGNQLTCEIFIEVETGSLVLTQS